MRRSPLLWLHSLLASHPTVGGQAIIEGVMMRGKQSFSMAVRRKNGEIVCHREPYIALSKRKKWLAPPVLRGFAALAESLSLGLRALNFSADVAMQDEKGHATIQPKTLKDSVVSGLTIVASLGIGLALFMYLPLLISSFIQKPQNPFLFNLIAGVFRISIFLGYLWAISQWKDIQRIFEYHGAEHKAIFTYESGQELTAENAAGYTTQHPRCGTSFLLIVALVCIFLFGIVDGAYALAFGPYPTILHRFLVHVLLIPFVSGVSYELLKASDRGKRNPLVSALIQPGLWLQRITTRPPDDKQLEVAFSALKAVV